MPLMGGVYVRVAAPGVRLKGRALFFLEHGLAAAGGTVGLRRSVFSPRNGSAQILVCV